MSQLSQRATSDTVTTVGGLQKLPSVRGLLIVRDCVGAVLELPADHSVLKLSLQGCRDCRVVLHGRIVTETAEVMHCRGVEVELHSQARVQTLQVDQSSAVTVRFERLLDDSPTVTWSDCERLRVESRQVPQCAATVGFADMVEALAGRVDDLNRVTDQFTTRVLSGPQVALAEGHGQCRVDGRTVLKPVVDGAGGGDSDGESMDVDGQPADGQPTGAAAKEALVVAVVTELVLRTSSGFATTEREEVVHEARQEAINGAMERMVRESMAAPTAAQHGGGQ